MSEASTQGRQGTIGPASRTYGYLVGLALERGDLGYSKKFPGRMFARFEYLDKTSVFIVPDWELFELLSKHLSESARVRSQSGNYAYEKLSIAKGADGWTVSPESD